MLRTKKFGQVKRRLIRSKTSVNAESERLDVSASKKKIEKSEGTFKDYEDNFSVDTQSSAGMESEGALRIFSRSLPNYNVRYVQYLETEIRRGS
ncbi:hypothetical protein TNCV_3580451 [Trichonephila clavipes]|nr:hypothetical protein TNCV_3580451 [Trichonephila clavipes]